MLNTKCDVDTTNSESSISDEKFIEALVLNDWNATSAYKSLKNNVSMRSASTLGTKKLAGLKSSDIYKAFMAKVLCNVNELLASTDARIKMAMTKDILDRESSANRLDVDYKQSNIITNDDIDKIVRDLEAGAA